MNEKLFVIICEYIIGVIVVAAITTILLASWYDFRFALAKKQLQRTSTKLNKSRQPFVAIIIYVGTPSSSLIRCLESVLRSRYTNYQVVVANHTPGSHIRRLVKEYQTSHPKTPVTLYSAQVTLSRDQVIQRALKKVPASDYVMTIDTSAEISSDTLRHVMARFIHTSGLRQLQLRQVSGDGISMQSLVPQFARLTNAIVYKALSTLHLLRWTAADVSVTKQTPDGTHTHYASDITYSQPTSPLAPKPPIARLVLKLIIFITISLLITYWMWTTATLKSNLLLTLSWIVLSIWLLAVIWTDNLTKLSRKIELSVTVPFMYFVFYVYALVGVFKSGWALLCRYPYRRLVNAFKAELYSSHY